MSRVLCRIAPGVAGMLLALGVAVGAPRSYELLPNDPQPRLFAEGAISTPGDEAGGVFSRDGNDFYFALLNPTTTFPRIGLLCVSHWRDGRWTTPEVLPFSGKHLDLTPRLSPDGKTMFFTSSRPAPNSQTSVLRIWKVDRSATGWSEPRPLPPPVNSPDNRWNSAASVTADGTIYFTSDREEPGRSQIYRSRVAGGVYEEPEKLGPEINSEFSDYDPFVSADESLLFFASAGPGLPPQGSRPGNLFGGGFYYGRGDLYVSRRVNGKWLKARHLEHGVNSTAEEGAPALTPDGRHLVFMSERSPFVIPMAHRIDMAEFERMVRGILNGRGNIYTIPVNALGIGEKTWPSK